MIEYNTSRLFCIKWHIIKDPASNTLSKYCKTAHKEAKSTMSSASVYNTRH